MPKIISIRLDDALYAQLRAVIRYHHDSTRAPEEMQGAVALVQIADIVCNQRKIGFYLTTSDEPHTSELLERGGITDEHIQKMLETLEEDISVAESVLMG